MMIRKNTFSSGNKTWTVFCISSSNNVIYVFSFIGSFWGFCYFCFKCFCSWTLSAKCIIVLFKGPALGLCYSLNCDHSEAFRGLRLTYQTYHNFCNLILFTLLLFYLQFEPFCTFLLSYLYKPVLLIRTTIVISF